MALSIAAVCSMLWTSMIGVASVTVIVSASWPTAISTSMFAANPVVSSTPSRTSVLNPGREKVTE